MVLNIADDESFFFPDTMPGSTKIMTICWWLLQTNNAVCKVYQQHSLWQFLQIYFQSSHLKQILNSFNVKIPNILK